MIGLLVTSEETSAYDLSQTLKVSASGIRLAATCDWVGSEAAAPLRMPSRRTASARRHLGADIATLPGVRSTSSREGQPAGGSASPARARARMSGLGEAGRAPFRWIATMRRRRRTQRLR